MIIRNRLIEAELVEQMTLVVVLASHHRPPPTQNVVRRRNHCSPKPSNHFCNKIGTKRTRRSAREQRPLAAAKRTHRGDAAQAAIDPRLPAGRRAGIRVSADILYRKVDPKNQ